MRCPCKDCEYRHIACHSKCKNYKEWNDQHQKELKMRRRNQDYEAYAASLSSAIWNRRDYIG